MGLIKRDSLIGRLKITWAGLSPVSLSGVLWWVRRALLKLSVSRLPEVDMFSLSILLARLSGVWGVGGGWSVLQVPVCQEPLGG